MANRILKDSIWNSPTLARLDEFSQDQFPRWLLLADDWGCFDADSETIKGRVYPKRAKVTVKTVEHIRQVFYDAGLLFCWVEGEHVWGYWTSWDGHNYCNGSTVESDGKYSKRRRRTPEPPSELLAVYIKSHRIVPDSDDIRQFPQTPTSSDKFRQVPPGSDKILDPDPDPDLDPDPDSDLDSDLKISSSGSPGANTEPAKEKPKDPAYEEFCEAHRLTLDAVYVSKKGDFVQLAALRKAYKVAAREPPLHWSEAVKNYFSSQLSAFTLADLCAPSRYAIFRNGAVDRYGKLGGTSEQQKRRQSQQAIADFVGEVDGRI